MLYLLIILLFFVGYFLGSIPFGLLLTKWAGLGDVRNIGSGNIGATNVLRTGNKKIAALTLLFDGLKGTIAVILAKIVAAYVISTYAPSNHSTIFTSYFALSAAIGALLGHLFPIWLNFKGGKGVATYLGILLALSWQGALVFGIVWLLTAFFTRYSSLAAICALICVPISLWLFNINNITVFVITLMSILILYKHSSNISRLLNGKESKIGKKNT